MNETAKIVGINLGILLVYSILIHITGSPGDPQRNLGRMIWLGFFLGVHVFSILIVSLIYFENKDKIRGKAYLLATGVVLLIGLSTCFGGGH